MKDICCRNRGRVEREVRLLVNRDEVVIAFKVLVVDLACPMCVREMKRFGKTT